MMFKFTSYQRMANEKTYIKLAKTYKGNSALNLDVEKLELSYIDSGSRNGLSSFGEDLVKGCTLQLLISVNLEKDSYPIKTLARMHMQIAALVVIMEN